jgi:hypothetical protein
MIDPNDEKDRKWIPKMMRKKINDDKKKEGKRGKKMGRNG